MKELESLLAEASKIKSELKRLDEMEANARSAIVSATDEDVTTLDAQQKIADARLSLEVVSARRSKLKPPFSLAHKRLQEQFKAEGDRWKRRGGRRKKRLWRPSCRFG
jgi:DNA-directed RNA polymerase alpha subunit